MLMDLDEWCELAGVGMDVASALEAGFEMGELVIRGEFQAWQKRRTSTWVGQLKQAALREARRVCS